MVLAQELWTITHYVVTVDGPRLYIDFYSMSTGQDYDNSSLAVTPPRVTGTGASSGATP